MATELPKGHTELSRDARPITMIEWPQVEPGSTRYFLVGSNCERIEAYDENGHMSQIPWLAVFLAGEIHCRVAADQVSVLYG